MSRVPHIPSRNLPELFRNIAKPIRKRIITQTNFRDIYGKPMKNAARQSYAIDDTDMSFKGVDFWNDIEFGNDEECIHEVVKNDPCEIETLNRSTQEGFQDAIYSVYTTGEETVMVDVEVSVVERFKVRLKKSELNSIKSGRNELENFIVADVFVKGHVDCASGIDLGGDYEMRIIEIIEERIDG